MKRKFLAVVVTAAMVAGALPGIALAAPADEYKTETQETPDSQEELTEAIARGGEIDLTGRRIELTSPLSISSDVVIRGGTLVGTDSVTGNLVTLMGNNITLGKYIPNDTFFHRLDPRCKIILLFSF